MAPSSFPRGKKPAATGAKKRKLSSAQEDAEPAAATDALFGKKGVATTGGAAKSGDKKPKREPKKPRVDKDKDADAAPSKPKQAPVVSFKALKKGMLLLGVVRQVNNGHDLLVSLPNKLTGTVSLAECSDEFHAHQQQLEKQKKQRKPADEDEDVDEENALPPLSAIFSVGQFVPCIVLGTAKENKHKQVHLSLRMSLVHAELSPQTVTKGMALHASVSSVEDHGAIMNFGIRGLNAFVPRKDLPSVGGSVRKGQVLLVSVVSMNTHTNTATVTPERSQVVKAVTRGDSFTLKQLVPGMLLNVRVEDVLANGLSVNFLTFFTATVEQSHMSLPCRQGWEDAYRKGLKGRARIISIDAINKQVTLSMAPHVVHLQVPDFGLEVGDIVEKATIERIDPKIGMLLSMEAQKSDEDEDMEGDSSAKISWKSFSPAYVHISNVTDDHIDKIEKKFKVGESVKCRVIGFAPFDGMVMVSCKQSSLSQAVLRHKDLTPGKKVSGKILAIDSWGIMVEIGEGVRAVVQSNHVPPFVSLKKSNKKNKADTSGKYQVGRTIETRVLRVDLETKKTYLTMKKALVSSDLPVLASYEDAKMGFITHGFITKIAEYGVVVNFYNNVYGLVPAAVLRQAGVTNLEEAYVVGQVVKVCVTRCDVNKKRLALSFNTTATSTKAVPASSDPITSTGETPDVVGQTFKNLKIVNVESSCFRVETADGMDGVLPFVQLTDFPRQTALVDAIASKYSAGEVIDTPVLAISQAKDGVVTFSMKPLLMSLVAKNHSAILPKVFADVKPNATLVGFIASVNANKGVFVKFLNNLVAVAPKSFLSKKYLTEVEDGMFETGETIVCHVEKVDNDKQQFVVGFHERRNFTRPENLVTPAFFEAYVSQASHAAGLSEGSLLVGKAEKGEFLGLRPYGAVFSVEVGDETATVIVPTSEADDDWEEGTRVKLVATDYDFEKRVYFGSVDETLVKVAGSKNRKKSQKIRRSVGAKVENVTVMAIGANQKYVVGSIADGDNSQLVIVQLCDFWSPSSTAEGLGITVGSTLNARVMSPSLKSSVFTPFQELALLAHEPEEVLPSKSKKSGGANSTEGLPEYSVSDIVVGKSVTGRIVSIKESAMEIRVNTDKKKGGKVFTTVSIVDVDEHVVSGSVRHPFDKYNVKDVVTGRVIAVVAKGANKLKPVSEENPAVFHSVYLSLRAADIEGEDEGRSFVRAEWLENTAGRALLQEGSAVEGVVTNHHTGGLSIRLSHRVEAYVSSVELSNDVDVVDNFREHFPVGKRVKAYVLSADEDKQEVDASLVRSSLLTAKTLKPGSVVVGIISTKVSTLKAPAVMVQLASHLYGRVCVTELLPPAKWKNAMHELPEFATNGKAVRCAVLSVMSSSIDLSLREDALEDPKAYTTAQKKAETAKELNVGDLVTAIVASTNAGGCFVRLDRTTTARVLLRELSDKFVKDPIAEFPAGKLVAGRVTKKSDRGLEISLKASVVSEDVSLLKWSDLSEGMTVKGTITKIQPYGVFVKIDKSAISGLCHISEIADERVTQSLDQVFAAGDYVKAKILKIEDRRVSFGLKPSYFEGEESSSEEEDDGEEEEEEETSDEEQEAEPMEVDEEEEEAPKPKKSDPKAASKSDPVPMEVDEASSSETETDDEEETQAAPVEFTWDGFANVLDTKKDAASSDDDSDEEDAEAPTKAAAKKSKQNDEWIALREKALANNDAVPQSASDYERLLAASPHSSFLWIQYMAFHVSLTEVALARDVAVRATSAVSFRDEKEKLNVWMAYMNLEHDFGDDASFMRVFNSALQVNHPKRVYLHLVDLYARSNEIEDAEQTLATMQKKFRKSKQTWLRALQFYVNTTKQLGKAAETLQRSLQSLAAHKHLPVILKYGQLMYESGELDKARTIFEGILSNYPKRVDLWNVYVDKEIKFSTGDNDGVARVRALFERLLAMDFSAKKMKFWFKKFLQFEQTHGDDNGVTHVQQLAKDFVASAAGKQ